MTKLNKSFSTQIAIFILLILIAIGITFSYNAGYRINNFSLTKTGSLELNLSEPTTWVFVNENPIHTTIASSEHLSIPDVTPGNMLVTVLKNGYWPWAKHINLMSGERKTLYPFIVNQHISTTTITPSDTQYPAIHQRLFGRNNLVKKTYTTEDGFTISIEENILTIGCAPEQTDILCNTTIQEKIPFTAVAEYGHNSHALIYSTPINIIITELSPQGGRISHTMYTGKDLTFYSEENVLYIGDGGTIIRLEL